MHRERQFLRLCRHTRIMGRQHQRRGTVGKNQHWQKGIVVHWEGLFLKHHRTITAQTNCSRTEYSSRRPCFRKSNIHGRSAIAKPLITENNAQMRKRWCHDHKTWTSDKWKRARHMIRWVVLHVRYIRKSLRLENTQGSLQSGIPDSNSETMISSVVVWAGISWYNILLAPLLPIMGELL
jgi:hypothetical protein